MSKLGDKERKKLRRTAFELHLQDDQLIAVGHVATNAWWGWEDSNLQPNEFQCAVVWMRDHCKVVAIPTARPV